MSKTKKIIFTLIIFAVGFAAGGALRYQTEVERYNQKVAVCKPWFDIAPAVKQRIINDYVYIQSGKNSGSGCKIKPGYYLTALHVLAEGILNDSVIAVNDQRAKIVVHSKTDADIAIVSTYAEYSPEEAAIEQYNDFEDEQDVIVAGNPGGHGVMVQPAKIMRDAIDDVGYKKTTGAKVITSQYIDLGISGGCVYSADGTKLLGIVTKKYGNDNIGEVVPVSRPIK